MCLSVRLLVGWLGLRSFAYATTWKRLLFTMYFPLLHKLNIYLPTYDLD